MFKREPSRSVSKTSAIWCCNATMFKRELLWSIGYRCSAFTVATLPCSSENLVAAVISASVGSRCNATMFKREQILNFTEVTTIELQRYHVQARTALFEIALTRNIQVATLPCSSENIFKHATAIYGVGVATLPCSSENTEDHKLTVYGTTRCNATMFKREFTQRGFLFFRCDYSNFMRCCQRDFLSNKGIG